MLRYVSLVKNCLWFVFIGELFYVFSLVYMMWHFYFVWRSISIVLVRLFVIGRCITLVIDWKPSMGEHLVTIILTEDGLRLKDFFSLAWLYLLYNRKLFFSLTFIGLGFFVNAKRKGWRESILHKRNRVLLVFGMRKFVLFTHKYSSNIFYDFFSALYSDFFSIDDYACTLLTPL